MQVNDALHRLSDEAYIELCVANTDIPYERTAEGEIIVTPPAGMESDYRNNNAAAQLERWAKRDGRGKVCGPTAQFFLPDGSARSPDAAWISNEALARVSSDQRKKFPYLCPEFVIEVLSPSDRLNRAKKKMEQWIANGAQLGWLIDGDAEMVYVYQPNQPVETRKSIF